MQAGTLHLEDHEHILRNFLRPPPQTPESCRSATSAESTTPTSIPSTVSEPPAIRPLLPPATNHFVSHFSYDNLITKLTQLRRTASLIDRRLLAVSTTAAEELSGCDVRVRLVDCYGAEHGVVVRVYESFHLLHRRLLKLLPAPLHSWLHIGLLPASGDELDDKENVGATHVTTIHPLPMHCLHASVRQVLQHAQNTQILLSSPLPTLHLCCYADVEVWAANTLTQPATYSRLQNARVVGDRTLHEQFSAVINHQLRTRFSFVEQPTWRWYRATRVIGVGGQPLDMGKAVELSGDMRVLSCQLDQSDAVLVASIVTLPPTFSSACASSEVQLLVQRLAGDHITLAFDANETVAALKRCLHTSFHVPLDEQELFFQQQPLDDDSLIGSYLQPESHNRIALLLSSPSPVLVSSVVYHSITYYTHRAVHDVRELMLMRIPARREVRGWTVAQCVDWLEVSRDRIGRVWAAVHGRAVKGESSTGLSWLPDDEEEALWQQTRDSHIRQLDSVDLSSHTPATPAPSSTQRACSTTVVFSHELEAEEDGVARVEHIDLDDDSIYDEAHTRLQTLKRYRSAPVISPSKVRKRQRRRQRKQAAAVVDLRETVIDSAGEEEEEAVNGRDGEEEDVLEVQVVPQSAQCSTPAASTGSRTNAAHRQLSFTVLE